MLLLSACGGGGGSAIVTAAPTSSATPAPSPSPSPVPPPLTGIKAFHWATAESFGPRVMRFRFRLLEPSECTLTEGYAGRFEKQGFEYVTVLVHPNDTGYSESTFKEADLAYARAGDLRLGGGEGSNQEYVTTENFSMSEPGVNVLTVMSNGQSRFSVDADSSIPGYSFAISVNCDKPFDVLRADMGRELTLLSLQEVPGVAVVEAGLVASVEKIDASLTTVAVDSGLFLDVGASRQGGTLRVTHPKGLLEQALVNNGGVALNGQTVTAFNLIDLPSGPGNYRYEINRAAGLGNLVVAAYGFEQELDLRPGMLTQTPFKSN